jgi:glycosyltransferase involved in cell wall biosynthesis
MKSVTHVITTIELGGAEKQLLILAEQQVLLGYDVSIVFLKGKPELSDAFNQVGVKEIISLEGNSVFRQLFYLRGVTRDAQNVHAHLPRAELLVALSLWSKSRLIVSRHNAEQFFPGAPRFISSLLSRYVVSRAESVIAISSAVSKFLYETSEVSGKDKVQTIHYGKSPDFSEVVDYSFPTKVIGTVARLTEQKDYVTLLNAFALLLQIDPEYRLQIIGAGHLDSALKDFASKLGINENVEWLGKVNEPAKYISTWDLFILTSLYEGFGLVLLESMALGTPIVASNNSAIPEVLGVDYLGLARTCDPEDFLEKMKVLLRVEGRSLAVKQMKENIVRFNPAVMAREVCELYA